MWTGPRGASLTDLFVQRVDAVPYPAGREKAETSGKQNGVWSLSFNIGPGKICSPPLPPIFKLKNRSHFEIIKCYLEVYRNDLIFPAVYMPSVCNSVLS